MASAYEKIKVRKLKNSEVAVEGEVPAQVLEDYRKEKFEEWRQKFSAPGFRRGKVPEEVFGTYVNDAALLEEAAEETINAAFPRIVQENRINVLGRPNVEFTRLSAGEPLGFRFTVPVVPEIDLASYEKIAKRVLANRKPVEVSEADVDETITHIRRLRAGLPSVGKSAADTVAKDSLPAAVGAKGEERPLPELTDEFVKTLGNFENVAAFRAKIKENMAEEKAMEEKAKVREEIVKDLIEKSHMELSPMLIEHELKRMQGRREEELAKRGMAKDEYLKRIGKTEAEATEGDRARVIHELKLRFVIERIAEKEKISPDESRVMEEVAILSRQYPGANAMRLKSYVETALLDEKVLDFLAGGAGK